MSLTYESLLTQSWLYQPERFFRQRICNSEALLRPRARFALVQRRSSLRVEVTFINLGAENRIIMILIFYRGSSTCLYLFWILYHLAFAPN